PSRPDALRRSRVLSLDEPRPDDRQPRHPLHEYRQPHPGLADAPGTELVFPRRRRGARGARQAVRLSGARRHHEGVLNTRARPTARPRELGITSPAFTEILAESAYRRLWISGFCVNTARWMDLVVLGWLALSLTGSPFMVGFAVFVRSAPMMAFGPLAGVIADRIHRGLVLLFTQSLGVVTALALLLIFAHGRGGYGPLVALEALFGLLWALDFPARRTALYALVGQGVSPPPSPSERSPCSSRRWSAPCWPAWASRTRAPPPASEPWSCSTRRGLPSRAVWARASAA